MDTSELNMWLAIGTLMAGLIIGLIFYLRFMRKPENRHSMRGKRERNIEEIRRER